MDSDENIWINSAQVSVTPFQIALFDTTKIDFFNYNNLQSGVTLL